MLEEEEKGAFYQFKNDIEANNPSSSEMIEKIQQFSSFTKAIAEPKVSQTDILSIADATGFNMAPGIPPNLFHNNTSQKAMRSEDNMLRENSYKNVRERQKSKNINDLD